MKPPWMQRDWKPSSQISQVLSETQKEPTTKSPGLTLVTSSPTSTTVPMYSWPMGRAAASGLMPRYGHRSEPQMQATSILRIASVGSTMRGTSRSSTVTSPGACMTTPRMLVGMLVGRAGVVVLMKSSMYWRPVVLGRCRFRAYGPFSLCPRHCRGHPDRCQPKLRLPPGARKCEEAVGNRRRRAVGGFLLSPELRSGEHGQAWDNRASRCSGPEPLSGLVARERARLRCPGGRFRRRSRNSRSDPVLLALRSAAGAAPAECR